MSNLPTNPYHHPPSPGAPQPEILASGYGSAVGPARRRRSGARKALAVGATLVLVAGVGVGGYVAWSALYATGPQPAEALPASTVGYLSVDLDPDGRQKLEARETLGKFPALDGKIDTDSEGSLRESLFDRFQDTGACPDLDWADDVDPWLGDRFAAAAVDLGSKDDESPGGVTPVLVVQVRDADLAEEGLGGLLDCASSETGFTAGGEGFGWSITDGWAVLAESRDLAEEVTDAAAGASLSDDDDFQRWTSAAGDHGVLTGYASPEAGALLEEAIAGSMGAGDASCAASPPGDDPLPCDDGEGSDETQRILGRYLADFEGAGLQVRFADGGLEVESASNVDLLVAAVGGTLTESEGGDDVVSTLPDDTAAALGVGFEPGWFEALLDSYSALLGDEVDLDELLAMAEEETGLDLPDDVETLFGESAALAVGPGLDPEADDPTDVDVAIKIQGDPDRITAVLDELRDHPELAGDLGDLLDYDSEGTHVVVGPNSGYRERVLDQGNLGQSDKYEDVVPEAGRAGTVLYVDVDAFDDLLESETGGGGGDEELVENLEVFAAVGYSAWTDDDVAHAMLKVTTD